jgi:hypothetical protein
MPDSALKVLSVNVNNWSLVPPDVSITFRFSESVEARSAQAGIRFIEKSVRADVWLNEDATEATWKPLTPLIEGEHTLRIEDVTSRDGEKFISPWELHFVVAANEDPGGKYGQILLHRSRTRLRMSERQYSICKLLDPESGTRYEVALDERGETADLDALVLEDQRATFDKYGKIHPVLHLEIERRSDADRLPVGIWIAVEEEITDKSEIDIDPCGNAPEQLLSYRERIRQALEPISRMVQERYEGASSTALTGAPLILAELTPAQIRELAGLENVAGIFLHEREGIDDIRNSMQISGAEDLVNSDGWRATGVRVGVWEDGADSTTQLVIEAQFSTTPVTGTHTRLVTGIIRNTELAYATRFNGQRIYKCYAPQCRIYAANTKDTAALEWAVIDHACRVINQSFHRGSEPSSSDPSLDDILKDYLVVHFPFPTIVQAAGNYWMGDPDGITPPSDEYVDHKGFNSISVGNHDDTASAMDGTSVFRNPDTEHGDRELPEICANGTAVTAVGVTTGNSGTSFASPAVAGSVALLQQIDPALASWPEGSRAILFAAAVNVVGRTWARDLQAGVDESDGAGALDVHESARIVQHHTGRDNEGAQRGWDVGTFSPSSFDEAGNWRHVYRIHIPPFGTTTRVKVALAWDVMSSSRWSFGGFFTVWLAATPNDYDLFIYDDAGALVAWSASWDNSYEIAEFNGVPGRTYTVRVSRVRGNEASYYGLAWNIRNQNFFVDPTATALSAYTETPGG